MFPATAQSVGPCLGALLALVAASAPLTAMKVIKLELTSWPAQADGCVGSSFSGNPARSCFSAGQAEFDFGSFTELVPVLARHALLEGNTVDGQNEIK